jgi:hypothetical protein
MSTITTVFTSVVGVGLYYTFKTFYPKFNTVLSTEVVDAELTTATSITAVSTFFGPSLFFDSINLVSVLTFGIGIPPEVRYSLSLFGDAVKGCYSFYDFLNKENQNKRIVALDSTVALLSERQSHLELSYELLRNENNLLSIRIRELEVDF